MRCHASNRYSLTYFKSMFRLVSYQLPSASEDNQFAQDWRLDQILSWLEQQDLSQYQPLFEKHCITSGSVLLQVTEEHLLQMGITCVGHRLSLINAIDSLRAKCGFLPNAKYTDVNHLLNELDSAFCQRNLKRFPKRIILVRHAEGNVDSSLYFHVPDAMLEITEKGKIQAQEAGIKLKELIGFETCGFYYSPFLRSHQTCDEIVKHFSNEQILYKKEDPRIREQEWGNFQIPEKMKEMMDERRHIGAFFYRFPTGESGADVFDRVSTFLETLYRDMGKERCVQNIIIVSHGLFCRLFLTRFYHWTVEYFHNLWNFENCQFAVMALQKDGHYNLISNLKMNEV